MGSQKSVLGDASYEEFTENMIQSRQKVGPSIADDIKGGGILGCHSFVDNDGSLHLVAIP